MTALIERLLVLHEGEKLKVYQCSKGRWTIGVGRNVQDLGITREESRHLLANDLDRVESEASRFPWFRTLDPVRQAVILDMLFNMGLTRMLEFRKMMTALAGRDFSRAAAEMVDSAWYRQTGERALRLVEMMRTGREPSDLPR